MSLSYFLFIYLVWWWWNFSPKYIIKYKQHMHCTRIYTYISTIVIYLAIKYVNTDTLNNANTIFSFSFQWNFHTHKHTLIYRFTFSFSLSFPHSHSISIFSHTLVQMFICYGISCKTNHHYDARACAFVCIRARKLGKIAYENIESPQWGRIECGRTNEYQIIRLFKVKYSNKIKMCV